jgi:predicted transcriptional regulator
MELHIHKRSERISQATYLATNHIKDNEPLKWELRRESLSFLSCSRTLEQNEEMVDVPLEVAFQSFSGSAHDLISLLSLASGVGLISKNNSSLLIREIELILASLEQNIGEQAKKAGYVLSEEFFRQMDKGQGTPLLKSKELKKSTEITTLNEKNEVKKEDRVTQILEVLKSQPNSTIKDFSRIIKDCSEKTIQRELTILVEKGIIKKEGERRWSKYSLV